MENAIDPTPVLVIHKAKTKGPSQSPRLAKTAKQQTTPPYEHSLLSTVLMSGVYII